MAAAPLRSCRHWVWEVKRRAHGHTGGMGEAGGGTRSRASGGAARGSGRKPGRARHGRRRPGPSRRPTYPIVAQTPTNLPRPGGQASGMARVTSHVTAPPGEGLEAATLRFRFEPRLA